MRQMSAGRERQQGQALLEFLVIAVALLPLFLLVPLVAKYQDIGHATLMASRYVAFDTLVRYDSEKAKPVSQLEEEIRRRYFGSSETAIKSHDVAGDFKADQNPFWRGPTDLPLIARFADVRLRQNSRAGQDSAFYRAARMGSGDGLFGSTDVRTAEVSVQLANLPAGLRFYEPLDRIDLSMARSTAVLPDAWAGTSPSRVQEEAGRGTLFPMGAPLRALRPLIEPAIAAGELFSVHAPKLGALDYWTDQVPCGRLKPRTAC